MHRLGDLALGHHESVLVARRTPGRHALRGVSTESDAAEETVMDEYLFELKIEADPRLSRSDIERIIRRALHTLDREPVRLVELECQT